MALGRDQPVEECKIGWVVHAHATIGIVGDKLEHCVNIAEVQRDQLAALSGADPIHDNSSGWRILIEAGEPDALLVDLAGHHQVEAWCRANGSFEQPAPTVSYAES